MPQLEVPTTTPNQLPTPEQPTGERAFTLNALDSLRRKTQELERLDGETDAEYDARYAQHVDQSADAYMAAAGIDDSLRTAHGARLADILHTPDHYWYVGPRVYEQDAFGMPILDDEGHQAYHNDLSGTDKVWDLQAEMYGRTIAETEPVATDTEDEVEALVDIAERRELLSTKRDELAKLSAKRQGRLAGKGGEKYATAKQDYTDLMREVAKHDLRAQLDDEALSPDEKKAIVVGYLMDEQKILREKSLAELQGTPVSKFVNWMNKGGFVKRMFKGAAVGLGAGVAGAAIGFAAGAAGVATIGAGVAAAVTGATRFARGFATKDARNGRGINTMFSNEQHVTTLGELGDDQEHHVDTSIDRLDALFENDIRHQQLKRRKSVGAGVLGIAIGAGVAFAGQAAMDSGVFHGTANHLWNNDAHGTTGPDTSGTPNTTAPATPANPNITPGAIAPSDTPGTADAIRNSLGGGNAGETVNGALQGSLGSTEVTQAGLAQIEQYVQGYTVKPGDTIWGLSEKFLTDHGVHNPSTYQIDAVKDSLLADLQQRGIVGANGWLRAGQQISLR